MMARLPSRSRNWRGPTTVRLTTRCVPGAYRIHSAPWRGVEVITVHGLSFKRFLDIAVPLRVPVVVVTDNDGNDSDVVRARYADYEGDGVAFQVGEPADGKTLEPQIAAVNSLDLLNAAFQTAYADKASLAAYMEKNKTACALALFESKNDVSVPAYVRDAVEQ